MEHIITRRRGFRKLLAFLLCMASILGLLPAQAFAMSVGQTASSWLGDQYVGSDGNHYRAPAPYPILPTMQTEPSTYTPVPGAMLTGTIC